MKKLIWIVLVIVILGGCSSQFISIVGKTTAVVYVCCTQSTDRTNKEHIEILNQYMGRLDNVKVLGINEMTGDEMSKYESEHKKDKPHFKITFQIEKNLCDISKLFQTLHNDGYWVRCLTMDEVTMLMPR